MRGLLQVRLTEGLSRKDWHFENEWWCPTTHSLYKVHHPQSRSLAYSPLPLGPSKAKMPMQQDANATVSFRGGPRPPQPCGRDHSVK